VKPNAVGAAILALALLGAGGSAAAPSSRLTQQFLRLGRGSEAFGVNYWQYLPPPAQRGRPPVLIFLHGWGERGIGGDASELSRVALHGPPLLVKRGSDLCFRARGRRSCFLMLAPQSTPGHDWYSPSLVPVVQAMIERARRLGGDMRRVYLTGLSMGGNGTWWFAGAIDFAHGGRLAGTALAAIVPIAGSGSDWEACNIVKAGVAVWAFHGAADQVVTPAGSIQGVAAVNRCGLTEKALLTIYPGVGHDSWTRTYDPRSRFDPRTGRPSPRGINIYQWLLEHRRRTPIRRRRGALPAPSSRTRSHRPAP
jgi:predicted peptidase